MLYLYNLTSPVDLAIIITYTNTQGNKMVASKLVNGRIPVGQECPFKSECVEAQNGQCGHTGTEHTVACSCGYARLIDLIKRTS